MNVLSLFSGVGGMDRGLELAGHTVVGLCEIDTKARSVLRRHWPDIPIHDDVTTLDAKAWHGRVDLVAGGSPCQDLSVAGRRAGLDGERSGLFWHQCRIAAQSGARWVLWENVAGALSSNDGEDFAAVLWGLTGCRPAVPEDGWRTVGVCVGPDRTAVWRLLDARWFGVAQRRRRVFVVAGPRNECRPEILLEPESCGGDLRARPTAGKDVAGTLGGGSGGRGWAADTDRMTFVPTVSFNWQGSAEQGADVQTEFTGSLGCTRLRAVAISENQRGEIVESDYAHQLSVGGGKPGQGYPAVAYPLAMRGREDGAELEMGEPDTANAVRTPGGGSSLQSVLTPELAVRRLTPRECERLMGWPEVLEIEGACNDDIRRAIQGCRTQAGAAFATSDLLRPLWEYGEGGAAPSRHYESAGPVRGSVSFLSRRDTCAPWGLGARTGASGDVCCVRFSVPTEAAQTLEALFGPGLLGGDGQTIGAASLGCSIRLGGWTRWDADGNEIADSHRYRMCGNGVVSPVAEWIGRRLP